MERPKEGFIFKGVAEYWEERYANGGHSGSGSYGRLAEYKAEVVNAFCQKHKIKTVIEWGCGDGNQLSLMSYPAYLGLDVSQSAIQKCIDRFEGTKQKRKFALLDDSLIISAKYDLAISLDVIYHLVDDSMYYQYMDDLFRYAKKYVCIYAKNEDSEQGGYYNHMRFRNFTAHIEKHYPRWFLYQHIPNRYPYDLHDSTNTSPSDFYFYKKRAFSFARTER